MQLELAADESGNAKSLKLVTGFGKMLPAIAPSQETCLYS